VVAARRPEQSREELPRVALLSLGGTIASVPGGSGGAVPVLTGEELLEAVPAVSQVARLEAKAFRQIPSAEIRLTDIAELVHEVKDRVAEGVRGVVVTQGTDTLEETAFAADLLWGGGPPLVFTGAMRNPALPGADGPANVLAAVRVAVAPACRDLGSLVVLNDQVHAARFARKTHTTSLATFCSSPSGPVGLVTEDRVRILSRPPRQVPLPLPEGEVPAVALVKVVLGDDGRQLGHIGDDGYQGVVVEGMGGGHVVNAMVAALEELAKSMPVILASRTGTGEVLRATYGFPGSEEDLLGRGLIPAGWLDGLKARILLSLLLAAGLDRDAIAARYDAFGT
jgi:L-asparaginase